jgi:hypothetical protein
MHLGTLGSLILAAVTLVSVAVAAFYAFRFAGAMKASADAAEAWKRERDAEVSRRERIEVDLDRAYEKIKVLDARVAELEARPDLRALELLMTRHEERALARHEHLIETLTTIASSLNGDGGDAK